MEIIKQLVQTCEEILKSGNVSDPIDADVLKNCVEDVKNFLNILSKIPHPLFDRIIVKPIEPEQSERGMIVPQNENQKYGVIISKGDDVKGVEVDDIVMWLGDMGETLTVDEEEFILAPYKELKAVIRD